MGIYKWRESYTDNLKQITTLRIMGQQYMKNDLKITTIANSLYY